MSDWGCEKARRELEEYLHNELCDEDAEAVSEHMGGCEDCTEEHLVGIILLRKVQQACQEKAPDDLLITVRARISSILA